MDDLVTLAKHVTFATSSADFDCTIISHDDNIMLVIMEKLNEYYYHYHDRTYKYKYDLYHDNNDDDDDSNNNNDEDGDEC